MDNSQFRKNVGFINRIYGIGKGYNHFWRNQASSRLIKMELPSLEDFEKHLNRIYGLTQEDIDKKVKQLEETIKSW